MMKAIMTVRNGEPFTTWLRTDDRTALPVRAKVEKSLENEPFARHQPFRYRCVADTSPILTSPLARSH
jgi:hypothetical protein